MHDIFVYDPPSEDVAATLGRWTSQGRQRDVDGVIKALLLDVRNRPAPLQSERALLQHLSADYFERLPGQFGTGDSLEIECSHAIVIGSLRDLPDVVQRAGSAHALLNRDWAIRSRMWLHRTHMHYPADLAIRVVERLVPSLVSASQSIRVALSFFECSVGGWLNRDSHLQALVAHPNEELRSQLMREMRGRRESLSNVHLRPQIDQIIGALVHRQERARLAKINTSGPVLLAP